MIVTSGLKELPSADAILAAVRAGAASIDRAGEPFVAADLGTFKKSGLSLDTVERAKIQRVSLDRAKLILHRSDHPTADYGGLYLPNIWPGAEQPRSIDDGSICFGSIRLDHPELVDIKGAKCKYLRYLYPRGAYNVFYIPPGTPEEYLLDRGVPVFITEGAKKALAIDQVLREAGAEALVIGLNGVYGWRTRTRDEWGKKPEDGGEPIPIPDFQQVAWTNRRVRIVFDSNAQNNGHIWAALRGLKQLVMELGAEECPSVNIPIEEGINGIDDFLGVHGQERTLALLDRAVFSDAPWGEIAVIEQALPAAPPFSLDLMPEIFRDVTSDISRQVGAPLCAVAATQLLMLAGSVNRAAMILPKRLDDGWKEVPNLWGTIILPPSKKKTPLYQAAIAPLRKLDDERIAGHREIQKQYQNDYAVWLKSKDKAKGPPPEKPELYQFLIDESTVEALQESLVVNSRGLMTSLDELASFMSRMRAENYKAQRPFYLSAWDGKSASKHLTITRGVTYVPHCCLSFLSFTQPAKMRGYLSGTVRDDGDHDGLMARFQIAVWPDEETLPYVDEVRKENAYARLDAVISKLARLPEGSLMMKFAPDAQELFTRWIVNLENRLNTEFAQNPPLQEHFGKYRSLVPSIALLFELAGWAAGAKGKGVVSLDNTRLAIRWAEFLAGHARRIYACVMPPSMRALNALAEKIAGKDIGDRPFSCADVYRKGWPGLDSKITADAISGLVEAHWIRTVYEPLTGPGPRRDRYEVNPALDAFLAKPTGRETETIPSDTWSTSPWAAWQPSQAAADATAELPDVTFEEQVAQKNLQPTTWEQQDLPETPF